MSAGTKQSSLSVSEKKIISKHSHTLKKYRKYLSNPKNTLYRSEVLRRLAVLELDESEALAAQREGKKLLAAESALRSSIKHYRAYLKLYRNKKDNDHVLYQLARAYDLAGETEKTLVTLNEIARRYPASEYIDEVQFRRGEILFVFGEYLKAEQAYKAIIKKSKTTKFREKALYKLAWSQFKQENYVSSLYSCINFLDRKYAQGKLKKASLSKALSSTEKGFIDDVLRLASLSLTYQKGTKSIQRLIAKKGDREYIPLLYQKLSEFYLKSERTVDSTNVLLDYVKQYPLTVQAFDFYLSVIDQFKSAGLADLLVKSKKGFVRNFDVGSQFWKKQNRTVKRRIKRELKTHIRDIANYYHALATKSGRSKDYIKTTVWYRKYIHSLPSDVDTPLMNFMLAESLDNAKRYPEALKEYIKTAYDYWPHSKSDESGYASILVYKKIQSNTGKKELEKIKKLAFNNSIRFCNKFKNSKYTPAVISKISQALYAKKDYKGVAEFLANHEHLKNLKDKSFFKAAWLINAHSLFEMGEYASSEQAYSLIRDVIMKDDPIYNDISEKLAATIYLQGEIYRDLKYHKLAYYHFIRIGKLVPTSKIVATAQYDAAATLVQLKKWDEAIDILEKFRIQFPENKKFTQGISEKLVLSYTKSGMLKKAANEAYYLSGILTDDDARRNLIWLAAETYQNAGVDKKANDIYKHYINEFPDPFVENIEAHLRVIEYVRKNNNPSVLNEWLLKTVKAEKSGHSKRTDRTKFIAANAALELAEVEVEKFKKLKLNVPLNVSLKTKKKSMKNVLKLYSDLMAYGIADISTASTYYIAEIYGHFASSLMDSERPGELNEEELEQYDILLEEQAYPFEEKSIEVHGVNARRTSDEIFDSWVKKSLHALENLQPVRYKKTERIDAYVESNY